MTAATQELPPSLARLRLPALLVGLLGLALCAVGAVHNPHVFYRSYLFAYLFWLGLALGGLAIVMLHHMTGGAWGFLVQRVGEAASRTLPLLALLFVPLLFGIHDLYQWADPNKVAASKLLQHKAPYLNVHFFLIRTAIYFGIWLILAHFINRWSRQQDNGAPGSLVHRMQRLSAPGLVLYGFTVTFAAFDWVMSMDVTWFSTIYGLIFVVAQVLSCFAFIIVLLYFLRGTKPMDEALTVDRLHDVGKLMFGFVMLWAYIQLSQFIIIWYGNLPDETSWYLERLHHGWSSLTLTVVALEFAVPFLFLLTRYTKRRIHLLVVIAMVLLVARLVELFALVKPAGQMMPSFNWLDIVAPIGLGGIWLATFLWTLARRPLLAEHDPRIQEAFAHAAH